ncbi:hypothetical protein ACOSQ3_009502 [Xanthoceras sorbifolium]
MKAREQNGLYKRTLKPQRIASTKPRGGRPSRSDVDERGQGKKQDVPGTSVNCNEGVDNDAQTGCVFGRGDEGSVEKSNVVDTSIVATVLPVSEVVVQQEYVHTVSSAGGNVVTSDAGDPPSSVSVLPVDVKSNVVTDGVYVGSDSKENVVSSSVGCGKDSVYGAFSASGADSVSFSFDPSFVEESQVCESAALSAIGNVDLVPEVGEVSSPRVKRWKRFARDKQKGRRLEESLSNLGKHDPEDVLDLVQELAVWGS